MSINYLKKFEEERAKFIPNTEAEFLKDKYNIFLINLSSTKYKIYNCEKSMKEKKKQKNC